MHTNILKFGVSKTCIFDKKNTEENIVKYHYNLK